MIILTIECSINSSTHDLKICVSYLVVDNTLYHGLKE